MIRKVILVHEIIKEMSVAGVESVKVSGPSSGTHNTQRSGRRWGTRKGDREGETSGVGEKPE